MAARPLARAVPRKALPTAVWVHPHGIHGGIWGLAVNLIVHIVVSLLTKPENKETLSKFFDEHTMTRLYVKKEV